MRSTVDGGFGIIKQQHEEEKIQTRHMVVEPEWMVPTEIVIETSSYTRKEWVNMFLLDHIILQSEVGEILAPLTKYLSQRGVKHSTFYRSFWNEFLYGDNKLTPSQNNLLKALKEQAEQKVEQSEVVDFEYFSTPPTFPFQIRCVPGPYFNIIFFSNVVAFYMAVLDWCNNKFGKDPIRDDLISFLCGNTKNLTYIPNQYQFTTSYNWLEYIKTGNIASGKTTYVPYDEAEWGNISDLNIRIRKHFLPLCSNSIKTRFFQDIRVMHE